jgi:hypothetical protein
MRGKKRFNLPPQFLVTLAGLGQILLPLCRRRPLECLSEEFFKAVFGTHGFMRLAQLT